MISSLPEAYNSPRYHLVTSSDDRLLPRGLSGKRPLAPLWRRLRQAMSDVRSDKPNVCSVNRSIGPHIFAKVAVSHGLTDLPPCLADIHITYCFIRGCIAD